MLLARSLSFAKYLLVRMLQLILKRFRKFRIVFQCSKPRSLTLSKYGIFSFIANVCLRITCLWSCSQVLFRNLILRIWCYFPRNVSLWIQRKPRHESSSNTFCWPFSFETLQRSFCLESSFETEIELRLKKKSAKNLFMKFYHMYIMV